ncbi:MAG: hypothetical protein OXH31_02230 [Gammaproteobacteria bacterium]|nr:hypothetical protein [Gammaproteobacteria bacterium]
MLQPIFRLLLFRGSPVDVNGSFPTIATFTILLVAFVWLTLPSQGSTNLSPEVVSDLRKVLLVIPIVTYAFAALMIFTVLNIRKFNDRFPKTISACLGLLLLFQAGVFLLSILSIVFGSILSFIFGTVQIAMFCWFIGAGGYVFQHAFSLKLYQGILATIVIMLVSTVIAGIIVGIVFPEEVGTFAELQNQRFEIQSSE